MSYTEEEKAAILAEYDRRRANRERAKDIEADFKSRGIPRTFQNWRTAMKKPTKAQETTMPDEAVEVLPGQLSIDDADTPADVHYGAVHEFDRLPEDYAKVIQPMREYTEAEDEALKESVRLFGFIGAIVRDQYGRILDGNQRARVARWFGKGCPFTITEIKDDAEAMEIANQLNLARRHFTPEQREKIAASLREQGRSYRYIAEALHVSHTQARTDVLEAAAKVETDFTPEPPITHAPVPTETRQPVKTDEVETNFTPETGTTDAPLSPETTAPQKRIQGKDGKSYADKRTPAPKLPKSFDVQDIESKIKDLYMGWLRHCDTQDALETAQFFLNTLSDLAQGRGMQLQRQ